MADIVGLIIASIGFLLAIIGLWQASKIGSPATLEAIRRNGEEVCERIQARGEETRKKIEADGKATRRRIAETHLKYTGRTLDID